MDPYPLQELVLSSCKGMQRSVCEGALNGSGEFGGFRFDAAVEAR